MNDNANMIRGKHNLTATQNRALLTCRSLFLVAIALLSACASQPSKPPVNAANDILFGAMGLVGTPYHWGGNSPQTGFDCSGLVNYVYESVADIQLPRTSLAMSELDTPKLGRKQLAAGDLVFFHGGSSRISHVGIYVGKGRFVHAPNSGGTVRLDSLDNPYWSSHFSFGRRVLDSRNG